ncbi:MAG TPA: hypothetical protein DCR55_11980 [Lentisphaeria bacterium]|jgi:hypothetical protein|nr:hypothetical protein [Lentisphaeria bacterium]
MVDPRHYGCREVRQFLYDYTERGLGARVLLAMDNHLMDCQTCRDLAASYERTTQAAKLHIREAQPRMPDSLRNQLARRLNNIGQSV